MPHQRVSTYDNDVFGQPGQTVVPKIKGSLNITTPPAYYGNDNITQSTAPTGAVTRLACNAGDELVTKVAPPDSDAAR